MNKITWRLWACGCGNEMKINKQLDEKEYEDRKACICGGELQFVRDLEEGEQ